MIMVKLYVGSVVAQEVILSEVCLIGEAWGYEKSTKVFGV